MKILLVAVDILDSGSWRREEASVTDVMVVNIDTGQNLYYINVSITINNVSDLGNFIDLNKKHLVAPY
jgi:hypothetical protein